MTRAHLRDLSVLLLVLSFAGFAKAGTITSATAVPSTLAAGVATQITFTAVIGSGTVVASSVNLQQVNSLGVSTVVGAMYDDGTHGDGKAGDGIFTLQFPVFQQTPGALTFRASAGFLGSLTRALSAPISVNVTGVGTAINITAPLQTAYLGVTPTVVTGTVSDSHATVTVNGLPAQVSGTSFSASIPLREGSNLITAVAQNSNGGAATATETVTLDTTPPHVTINSPPDGAVTTSASIAVSGIVNDLVVGTVNPLQATVSVNGVAAQVSNRSYLAASTPLQLGPNTIVATARDRAGNFTSVSTTITRVAPTTQPTLQIVSGNMATGAIKTQLPAPLVVQALNAAGQPIVNTPVVFQVTNGDGGVSPNSSGSGLIATAVNTNAQGMAQVVYTLGSHVGAGDNQVQASATGIATTPVFTESATSTGPSMIVIDSGGNQRGVVGQALPLPFIAIVTDAGHNRLTNVPVSLTVTQGGGSLGGKTAITTTSDSDGRVEAVLTLGSQAGLNTNVVAANFAGNIGLPATFTASAFLPGPPANTSITGVVLDNSSLPIEGVTMRLYQVNHGGSGVPQEVVTPVQTNADGYFSIQPAPVGVFKLMADGNTVLHGGPFPTLEYDLVTVSGQNNTVGLPIYLQQLKPQNELCVTPTTGGTLTIPEAPGFALKIAPGSAVFPGGSRTGCVYVTPVNMDKVPMVPGFGQQPRFIVTIQPAGTIFTTPAQLTIPNVDGLKPRAVTEMYSYDHDLASFVAIGTGTVSADGSVIASDPGVGVVKAGWHCGGDPNSSGSAGNLNVTVTPTSVVLVKGGTKDITASGTPPQDGVYSWSTDDARIVSFDSQPPCSNQATCTARLKGVGKGTTTVHVTFTCLTSGISVTADVQVTVAEIKNLTFQNSKMSSPREIDQPYKYLAVYTGSNVRFSFTTDPADADIPSSEITWTGAATGHDREVNATFSSRGRQTVTLTIESVTKDASIQVTDVPTGIGQTAWAALDPVDTAVALAANLIGTTTSTLEPSVWAAAHYTNPHNGLADAARHTYWNCLLTIYTNASYAAGLTYNHEVSGEPSPSTETTMDLTNNASGVGLGNGIPFLQRFSNDGCRQAVASALSAGSLVYMDSSYGPTDTNESAMLQPTNK